MNSSLSLLHPYPFEKLNQLFADIQPANMPLIPLSIGEPKHPAPEFVKQAIIDNFKHLSTYPNSKGLPELREAISGFYQSRYGIAVPATRIAVTEAWTSALGRIDGTLVTGGPTDLVTSFSGAALEQVTDGTMASSGLLRQVPLAHDLEIVFYADDGSIIWPA